MDITEFLNRSFLENSYGSYLTCFSILAISFLLKDVIIRFISNLLHRAFNKHVEGVDVKDFIALEKAPLRNLILLVAIYIGANQLKYPDSWELESPDSFGLRMLIEMGFAIMLIITITWIILRFIDFIVIIMENRASKTESKVDDQLVSFFKDVTKIFVVIMSVFFTLASVFEINIATLIGGLGIGGLAVALAAKETLENLLGSVTIFLDRPFVIGDKVKIGEVEGHVENIGLRSTRIRTFEKSLVTVPNKLMVDAELENTTEKTYWRLKFTVGVLYSTDADDIRNIISQSLEFLDKHSLIEDKPIVKLSEFNSSSIDILYYVLIKTTEWGVYLDAKEEIYFKVMEIVNENNTEFAFPTRTLYLEKDSTEDIKIP